MRRLCEAPLHLPSTCALASASSCCATSSTSGTRVWRRWRRTCGAWSLPGRRRRSRNHCWRCSGFRRNSPSGRSARANSSARWRPAFFSLLSVHRAASGNLALEIDPEGKGWRCAAEALIVAVALCSDASLAGGASGNDQQLRELDVGIAIVAGRSPHLRHLQMSERARRSSAGQRQPPNQTPPLPRPQCLSISPPFCVATSQTVLNDAAQIRKTLEAFSSVLEQMSEAVEVSALGEQLAEADRRLAAVQNGSAEPLAQLQRAAAVSPPRTDKLSPS